ncbi:hypothetical protein BRC71_02965 [Halobacteriales archaeon QH_7_65_31]|nr:MAG: hypothetical protein BRC71_02965 [Halobacteriales archaeon QH_7_65_31]PSQ30384.1 MAG: hypothetical protein BRD16_07575 [Halobacteriales archaeon SW_6_65_46]
MTRRSDWRALAGSAAGGGLATQFDYTVAFRVAGGAEILLALVLLPFSLRLETGGRRRSPASDRRNRRDPNDLAARS